tara:strand:+ start:163 stop:1404 length:1242 start_codon:yes stop_codon:yes gene_type:complete
MSNSIKENLNSFSQSWESYVAQCKVEENGKEYFRNTKEHIAHKIFIDDVPEVFMSFLDNKKYTIKSSLGEGNTAAIPWLCIMHKQVTDSVTERFYVAYLFSRNAKKVFLSIGIGATQFSRIYGESMTKCVPKINDAKEQFKNTFLHLAPNNSNEEMDLFDMSDTNFIRSELSQSPRFKIAAYEAGCFFTKSYTLDDSLDETELQNDLKEYIRAYEKIIDDPISIPLIDNLAEIVLDEDDQKSSEDFDYEIPEYEPTIKEAKEKVYSPKKSKNNKKNVIPTKPSKRVGRAGEEHVYNFEYKKLMDQGREDLAKQIVKQYEDLSFFPGYDIKSFNEDGEEIYIEVKSTVSKGKDYFEISDNEVLAAKSLKDSYFIYQVTDALANPRISARVRNPMKYVEENKILLESWIYKMFIH